MKNVRFFKTLLIAIGLLAMSINQMWASYNAGFSLRGTSASISSGHEVNTYFGTDSKYCIYIWLAKNETFYLVNTSSTAYGPTAGDNTTLKHGTAETSGGYNSNKWKYTGNTGLVRICVDQSSSEWYPKVSVEEMTTILTGSEIMFYFGDKWGWGTKYINNGTSDVFSGNAGFNEQDTYFTIARVAASRYYVSNNTKSSFAGVQLGSTAYPGSFYKLYSISYGNNAIDSVHGVVPTFGTTSYSKATGTVNSGIAVNNLGQSSTSRGQTVYYYYSTDGGSTWTGFSPSDISGLSAGTYKIRAIACDGLLCVKSSNEATLTIADAPAVTALSASAGDVYSGEGTITLTATRNTGASSLNIQYQVKVPGSGSWTNIGEAVNSTTKTYSPTNGDGTYQFRAYPVGYSSNYYDASKRVYEHWNIYVQNNCNWASGVALYMFGNGTNASWPGETGASTACEPYGNKNWYKVTLNSKYTTFNLDNNQASSGIQQTNNHTMSKVTYAPNTYWYFNWDRDADSKKYYNLTAYSLSAPTVTITPTIISCTQIKLVGTITVYGGYGSAATDLEEVYFKVGGSKTSAECTSESTFTTVLNGLTAGTDYTVQAFATSVKATGSSSSTTATTHASGTYTIRVRIPKDNPSPNIYAWTDAESCGGVLEKNATFPGEAMTSDHEGTVYEWFSYSMDKTYNKFKISTGSGANESDNFNAPQEETCYWYLSTENNTEGHKRLGSMGCPSFDPTLMIETTAGGGTYTYYDMTGSGTVSYSVDLAAKSTYKFKPMYGGEWLGKASTTLTRANNSTNSLSAAVEDELKVTTDAAGSYTFSYTPSTNTVEVGFPTAYAMTFAPKTFLNGSSTGTTSTTGGTLTAKDQTNTSLSTGNLVKNGGSAIFTATKKSGFTFNGFFSNEACTTAYTAGSGVAFSGEGNTIMTLSGIDEAKYVYAKFSENMCAVTLAHTGNGSIKIGDDVVTSTTAGVTTTRTIVAVPDAGWYFAGWVVSDGADCNVASTAGRDDNASSSTTLSGLGAGTTGTVTARFVEGDKIYFRNVDISTGNKLWTNVYVFFDYTWSSSKVKSANDDTYRVTMTEIGSSKIYYAYVPRAFTIKAGAKKNVAFSNYFFAKNTEFTGSYSASARGDYNRKLNMFVPNHGSTGTESSVKYYNNGYWMQYDMTVAEGTGYYLWRRKAVTDGNNSYWKLGEFTAVATGGTSMIYSLRVDNTTSDSCYYFINTDASENYAVNDGAITDSNYANRNLYNWSGSNPQFKITATSEGTYTIIVDQSSDVMKLTVDYPISAGDYRLKHTYSSGSKTTYSDVIKKDKASSANTVSLFLSKDGSPTLVLQRCISVSAGVPVWSAGDATNLSGVQSAVTSGGNGVYQFDVTINTSSHHVTTAANTKLYDGPFYIKTDYAPGGWVNYKENEMDKNTINFSRTKTETFDYYFVKWINDAGTNIKCVIANDYCNQLSDTLKGDDIIGVGAQTLPLAANVRFSYNSATNEIKRTYINGASGWEASFLSLKDMYTDGTHGGSSGSKTITKTNDAALTNDTISFKDKGNWIYQINVKAKENAYIYLSANYKFSSTNHSQDLIGTSLLGNLLIGSGLGDTPQPITIIYDFKTNNLIAAWTPATTYSTAIDLHSDVLLIHNRKSDGSGDVVNKIDLTGSGTIKDINHVYSALRFQKTTSGGYLGLSGNYANTAESYYRYNYWISFPYDVKMTDIFGVADYGSKWRIQYYDGKERAEKGWYKGDGTTSFWKTMPMSDDAKLNKGEGYVLQLSPSAFKATGSSSLWALVDEIYLYFPSKANFGTIGLNTSTVTLPSEGYVCTRGAFTDGSGMSHDVTDSYWHVFGIPTFSDATGTTGTGHNYYDGADDGDEPEDHNITNGTFYFYKYENSNNSSKYNEYTATSSSGFTFQPMHAYMIQMYGTLNFATNSVPASVAARKRAENVNHDVQVELQNEDVVRDQTFITLRDSAEVGFAFNEDLMKIHNDGKTNIYSYAGPYDVAANILPVENRTVALGIEAAANGAYTFHMPSNFSGTATLIDTYAQTRTNLALEDYEVTLEKGTYENRFYLEIDINKVTTDVKEVTGDGLQVTGVRKYIYDNQLYIMKNGIIYDARGNRVK